MRIHFVVSGRVQGVSFRYSARAVAERVGARGWIRNLPSGQVEGVVEGEPDAVDAFIAWSREGPPGARVEGVTTNEDSGGTVLSGFEIRR